MKVRKLDLELPQDIQKFVGFPHELYRNCAQWVPPNYSEAAHTLNRRLHPFYRHSTADFFVVESEGQALGRVAALNNTRFNAYRGTRAVFFSQFEAVEDRQAARLLFETVYRWAVEQGCDEIIGPRSLIGFDASGVLIDGFEHRPVMGGVYNFPYYDALITDSGLEATDDFRCGFLRADQPAAGRITRIAEDARKRRGLAVQGFTAMRQVRPWLELITPLLEAIFQRQPGYYPCSDEELTWIVEMMLGLSESGLIKVLLKGDQVVGFIMAYHDVSAALQKSKGQLWPFGWFYLIQERKHSRQVQIAAMGVLPAYRNQGGDALLYSELLNTSRGLGIERIAVTQIAETNTAARAELEALGVRWVQRSRLYRMSIR